MTLHMRGYHLGDFGVVSIPLALSVVAAGAGAYAGYKAGDDPDKFEDLWSDKDVFNGRMSQLNRVITHLNTDLSSCAGAWNTVSVRKPFRTMWEGWSRFYKDVGTLEWFDPSDAEVAEARQYAKSISKYLVEIARVVRQECPDYQLTYPDVDLLPVNSETGSIGTQVLDDTQVQEDLLERAKLANEIAKLKGDMPQEPVAWNKIFTGAGWLLGGALLLGAGFFGYRIYKESKG